MRAAALALILAILPACAPSLEPTQAAPRPPPAPAPPLHVAITVDDLPFHGPSFAGIDRAKLTDRLLDAFRRHHVGPVYGFVNGRPVDQDPGGEDILRRWIAAGNPLGNHTYSHPSLNKIDVAAWLADLEKGEVILQKLVPDPATWKFFRYPFLNEGNTLDKRRAVRGYLRDHGYAIAEVTIDADDWAFNPPFARCTDRHDAAALADLHQTFVEAHVDELRRMRDLTRALAKRDVPQVLLLHIGAADADVMDDLLTAYEREGVRWIDLRTALSDPFYAIDPDFAYPYGAAFPYVVAKARGVPVEPPIFARDLEGRLDKLCR